MCYILSMRIVLATPLYPPDVDAVALYVKELAGRLAALHSVTVVCFTRLPEEVAGVRIIAVDKRQTLPFRLFSYARALARAAKSADVIYAINGASVELPLLLVSLLRHVPIIFCIADVSAHQHAERSLFFKMLERAVRVRSRSVVTDLPLARPEILPLEQEPKAAFAEYEDSWGTHMSRLSSLFIHD